MLSSQILVIIWVYQSVSVCISLYQSVSVCISCISLYQCFRQAHLAKCTAPSISRFEHSPDRTQHLLLNKIYLITCITCILFFRIVKNYLRRIFGHRVLARGQNLPPWFGVNYPPRSPDLTVPDIYCFAEIKSEYYFTTLTQIQ
jgi:hypothetical protein